MAYYYLVDYVETDGILSPALPSGTNFLVLASSRSPSELSLCRIGIPLPTSAHLSKIPFSLSLLLAAAEQYAPAMALTQTNISTISVSSRTEFCDILSERLQSHLMSQTSAPYFLARSRLTEEYHKYAGCYYWIVGYDGSSAERAVQWVSEDYNTFRDPVDHFDVDLDWLAQRWGYSVMRDDKSEIKS